MGPRSARCSVFKDRCASATGLVALHAWSQARASPRRTGEYSAAADVCLGEGSGGATRRWKAALSNLQDLAVERRIGSQLEGVGGDRLAVKLDPALLDQAPGLARGSIPKPAADQHRHDGSRRRRCPAVGKSISSISSGAPCSTKSRLKCSSAALRRLPPWKRSTIRRPARLPRWAAVRGQARRRAAAGSTRPSPRRAPASPCRTSPPAPR